jgi:hypothetical protein
VPPRNAVKERVQAILARAEARPAGQPTAAQLLNEA